MSDSVSDMERNGSHRVLPDHVQQAIDRAEGKASRRRPQCADCTGTGVCSKCKGTGLKNE